MVLASVLEYFSPSSASQALAQRHPSELALEHRNHVAHDYPPLMEDDEEEEGRPAYVHV